MAVNENTIYFGGWYGDTGDSLPVYQPFWDGWYDRDEDITLEERVGNIEIYLLSHNFLEIGPDGHYREVKFVP